MSKGRVPREQRARGERASCSKRPKGIGPEKTESLVCGRLCRGDCLIRFFARFREVLRELSKRYVLLRLALDPVGEIEALDKVLDESSLVNRNGDV